MTVHVLQGETVALAWRKGKEVSNSEWVIEIGNREERSGSVSVGASGRK